MSKSLRSKERIFVLPVFLGLIVLGFQKGAQDPLNPIKLWIAGGLAIWLFSSFLAAPKRFSFVRNYPVLRVYIALLLLFLTFFIVAVFRMEIKSIGLLGDTGRNIGLLHYLSLLSISLYCALICEIARIRNLYFATFILGAVLSVYGTFQHFKIDFLHWSSNLNNIILTVGNPDFASSLLSIFSIMIFAGIFVGYFGRYRYVLVAPLALSILDIYWTQALQGVINILVGFLLIVIIRIWQKNRVFGISLSVAGVLSALLALFGSFKVGPLAHYLYKASVNDRGYDWRAALAMFKTHPWFGVGVDRYGAYFPQYKDSKYTLIYGYDQTVNNAHNVFLQIFATTGIFVGLGYCLLVIFVAVRAAIALRRHHEKNQMLVAGVVSAWLAFTLQTLISPENLAISCWGWALSGVIVALSLERSESETYPNSKQASQRIIEQRNDFNFRRGVVFTLSMVVFLLFIVPLERVETNVYKLASTTAGKDPAAIDSYKKMASDTFNSPLINPNYKANIALSLGRNNFGPETVAYMKQTIVADKRNLVPYSYLAKYYEYFRNPKEAIVYRAEIARLDPWNADNLVQLETDVLVLGDKIAAAKLRDSIVKMGPSTQDATKAQFLLNKK
jgi:O-antigen ligase